MRTMIRPAEARGSPVRGIPLRGGRRIGWIETALAPIREQPSEERCERLGSAQALVRASLEEHEGFA